MEQQEISAPTTPKEVNPRRVLGRGLAALIPGSLAGNGPASAATAQIGLKQLPIERIKPSPKQPRKHFDETALKELSASIRQHGVLQPIVVRKRGEFYEIVAGERRWRAATMAGLREIPAVVKELSDSVTLQLALIENIQRQDLDPFEEAQAYRRLIREYGFKHDQLAEAMGKSRSAITNCLRLLKLPEPVLALVGEGGLTAGHARALMTLSGDEEAALSLAKDIVGRRMSVRDAEAKARQMARSILKRSGAAAGSKTATASSQTAEASVEDRLRGALGVKVRLRQRQGRGRG